VHLDELDLLRLQTSERLVEHRPPGRRVALHGHLGGDPELLAVADLSDELADDLLGAAVAGGGVDHRAAQLGQPLQHLAPRRQLARLGHAEPIGPQPDHRQLLARRTGWGA
jgi:hypothetical protein